MCGIIGKVGTFEINELKKLFLGAERRGTDATGIYFHPQDLLFKGPLTASKFWMTFEPFIKKYIPEKGIFIGHTRSATQGTNKKNENNHPITSRNYVLVHNGHCFNSEKDLDYNFSGECDSEKIIALMETKGWEGLKSFEGSAAIAVIKKDEPKSLYLWRKDNPMILAYSEKKGLFFGSTKEIIESAIEELKFGFFEVSGLLYKDLPEEHLYKVSYKNNISDLYVEDMGEMKATFRVNGYCGYQQYESAGNQMSLVDENESVKNYKETIFSTTPGI